MQVEVVSRPAEVRVMLVLLTLQDGQVHHLALFVLKIAVYGIQLRVILILHFEHTLAAVSFNSMDLMLEAFLFDQG